MFYDLYQQIKEPGNQTTIPEGCHAGRQDALFYFVRQGYVSGLP
jgi:hypothetical protein